MAKAIGSFDLASLKNLRDDVTQYFWFESNSSSAWGSGAHVTLYPESQFTNPSHANYMKGQNIIMNTDGFSIRNGALPMMVLDNNSLDFNVIDTTEGTYTKTATFGLSGSQIGQSTDSHVEIDYRSLRFVDKDGDDYVYFSDLIDADGNITVTYEADGTQTAFKLVSSVRSASDVESVKINNVSVTSGWTVDYNALPAIVTFSTPPVADAIVEFKYKSRETDVKAYTLGFRRDNNPIGMYSFALGVNVIASGIYSYSEGTGAIASGDYSHAEGWSSEARGIFSHAQNDWTIASRTAQTALGTFNAEDTGTSTHPSGSAGYGQYAIILGNGRSDLQRSNALTVDWRGNVETSGDVTDGTGNLLPFIAKKGVTTYDEITAALDAGKIVFAVDGNLTYTYSTKASGDYIFTRVRNYSTSSAVGLSYLRVGSSNVWTTTNSGVVRYVGGTASLSNIATNSYKDATISFGETFGSTPHVTACLSTTGTAGNIGNVSVSVHTITTTGCKIRVFNNRGSSLSPNVEWIAIGT